jgi:tripartite-type tricarboxylate transporter receptor subunit TctC
LISILRLLFALLALVWLTTTVFAQDVAKPWPSKPLRIIVGFPAGSVTDNVARVVAEQLASVLGQPVVVENKPGANGALGVGEVAVVARPRAAVIATGKELVTEAAQAL